jgi:flagellar motor switch protein FliM
LSEVLSQSEIDALLSALTSGEVSADEIRGSDETNRVRSYDFRRAMRFSKDQIRIVSRIHEHFGRLFTTYLSGQLRSVVQFTVESVDQVPYEEFIRSIPVLTVVQLTELSPLPGRIALEFNPQIVFSIVDRVMGGVMKGPYKERELTEIEQVLFKKILSPLPNFIAESWKNIVSLQPRLLSVESNPQFLQLTTPNETVLVIALSARIGPTTGFINICIPHLTVEPIMRELNAQRLLDEGRMSTGVDSSVTAAKVASHLSRATVDIAAVLGETELSLSELLDLNEGDVIPLGTSIHDSALVYVNGIPTFRGAVGQVRKRYGVQIQEEWKEAQSIESKRKAVPGRN